MDFATRFLEMLPNLNSISKLLPLRNFFDFQPWIREIYHYIQTIDITCINLYRLVMVGIYGLYIVITRGECTLRLDTLLHRHITSKLTNTQL